MSTFLPGNSEPLHKKHFPSCCHLNFHYLVIVSLSHYRVYHIITRCGCSKYVTNSRARQQTSLIKIITCVNCKTRALSSPHRKYTQRCKTLFSSLHVSVRFNDYTRKRMLCAELWSVLVVLQWDNWMIDIIREEWTLSSEESVGLIEPIAQRFQI